MEFTFFLVHINITNISMADRKPSQTALEKMQDIANRLISNTPELSKIL